MDQKNLAGAQVVACSREAFACTSRSNDDNVAPTRSQPDDLRNNAGICESKNVI